MSPPNEQPARLVFMDGAHKIEVSGATAALVRMLIEQQLFFNAAYNAGVVHLHFSGKDGTANMKTELNWQAQASLQHSI